MNTNSSFRLKKELTVPHRQQRYIWPAATFVRLMNRYRSDIRFSYAGIEVNGRSVLDLLSLEPNEGSRVQVYVEGPDAAEAMREIDQFTAQLGNKDKKMNNEKEFERRPDGLGANTTIEAEIQKKKSRILIVDDNRRFAETERLVLQRTGKYVVCVENDARRALETARSFNPDLILVDLLMPGIDGTDVAGQIDADWALHGVPIVFLTALITAEEASDGRRIYGHRIFAKPRKSLELVRVIEENLPRCA